VAAQWGNLAMKVEPAVKISVVPVFVGKLRFERCYTPEHNPARIFAREQGEQQAVLQEWEQLEALMYTQNLLGNSNVPTAAPPGSGGRTNYGSLHEDGHALDHHLREMDGRMFSMGVNETSQVGEMQRSLALELYDAVDVECDLTSPVPLRKPYVVLMARFHAVDAKPDQAQNWLYAAELEHLDEKPVRVRILKGGFPPGYVLESYQIHVYDGGHEVATNVSENRVPLTQSEAYKYLRADYLATHKHASGGATAVMGVLTPAERTGLGADEFRRTFFVRVATDGTPLTAFTDHELTQPVSDVVAGFVSRTRYFPALADGKPVEGVAELRFARLSL
jgi:hypothetical protein